MRYAHTQQAPLHWVITAAAAICVLGAYMLYAKGEVGFALLLLGFGVLTTILSLCFRTLTVRDGGDALEIRFGRVPLFRRGIPYASIHAARPARSSLIDGWGVHWAPGRGWTWNLWGRDCVELDLGGKTLRIGTDDRDGLFAFLSGTLDAHESA